MENFLARYYEDSDTYIATLGENVFLYGDVFDGLVYVGQISDFIGSPLLKFSLSSLQPYVPVITMAGSLGYAIYQNNGNITTGLIMKTLNPTAAILKSEEYEIGLLETMGGTLQNIEDRLDDIDAQLNEVLLELSVNTHSIIGSINDPHEYIGNIYNYEQELHNIGKASGPHQANQNDLDQLATTILNYGPDGVNNQINQINLAITASQSGNAPVLKNLTEMLVSTAGSSTNINKYENAYQALESYTMKLIGGEARGTNLLVDANLYQGNKNAAQIANDTLHQNIQDIMSLSDIAAGTPAQYGFIYNTVRLMLEFADPYYDAPRHDGKFLPDEAADIFERAEFLKYRMLDDNEPVVIVYSITEVGEEVSELKMRTLETVSRCTCSPASVSSHLIKGRGYDNWNDEEMKYNDQYQLNVYTFHLEPEAGPVAGDYYVYGDGIKSTAVHVRAYDKDMTVNPDGDIVFGFGLLTRRDSSRFTHLTWKECYGDIDLRYRYSDSLLDAIVDGNYNDYLTNPLSRGVDMKTTCDEWTNHGDCLNMSSDDPCDDISLCTSFTYTGDDTRNLTMSVKLYRKMNMDADIYHKTDGEVTGYIHLYVRDEDSEKNYDLYENEYQHIQGWHYQYEDSSFFTGNLKLVPGHKYHVRLHMRASVHQGILNTAGYFNLHIHAAEPIRFIFE